jgi:ABC-type nitrate/sulfonate/bicarbonate transport system substrate-binding protein
MTGLKASAAAAVLVASAALAFSAFAQTPVKIRQGHSQAAEENLWLMDTPAGITPNRGKAYNFEFFPFRGADERFKAYEAGQLDCATGTATSIIFAVSQGIKLKILASISKESTKGDLVNYWVRADSGINSVKDLKGKIVALNGFKSGIELYVRAALLEAGMEPDRDVKFVVMRFPIMGEALRSGKVDLTSLVQPFATIEQKKGGIKKLFSSRDAMPFDEDLQTLYCGEAFLKKHPAAIRAYLADFVATTKWYLANQAAGRKALADAKKVVAATQDFGEIPDSYRDPNGRVDIESYYKLQDVMIKVGFQKNRIDPKEFIDLSFLPNIR